MVTHLLPVAVSVGLTLALSAIAYGVWLATRPRPIPIVVLAGDWHRRRMTGRRLGDGLSRLRRVLGGTLPADLIVVQQELDGGKFAGCHSTVERADGTRATVIRLALRVDGRRLTDDQVLAALADQCLLLLQGASEPQRLHVVGNPAAQSDGLEALFSELGANREHKGGTRA